MMFGPTNKGHSLLVYHLHMTCAARLQVIFLSHVACDRMCWRRVARNCLWNRCSVWWPRPRQQTPCFCAVFWLWVIHLIFPNWSLSFSLEILKDLGTWIMLYVCHLPLVLHFLLSETQLFFISQELSIFGYFRLLDKKIDSLIYCAEWVWFW